MHVYSGVRRALVWEKSILYLYLPELLKFEETIIDQNCSSLHWSRRICPSIKTRFLCFALRAAEAVW